MKGFQLQAASDGLQAVARLKAGFKPDLIITDINMPNMDGLELIKAVKALAGFRFTLILTLTTEGDAAKRDQGKRLDATGWLVKPISGQDLVKVVRQVVPGA
jgi:two-component system chemotaxis response regulator CheY